MKQRNFFNNLLMLVLVLCLCSCGQELHTEVTESDIDICTIDSSDDSDADESIKTERFVEEVEIENIPNMAVKEVVNVAINHANVTRETANIEDLVGNKGSSEIIEEISKRMDNMSATEQELTITELMLTEEELIKVQEYLTENISFIFNSEIYASNGLSITHVSVGWLYFDKNELETDIYLTPDNRMLFYRPSISLLCEIVVQEKTPEGISEAINILRYKKGQKISKDVTIDILDKLLIMLEETPENAENLILSEKDFSELLQFMYDYKPIMFAYENVLKLHLCWGYYQNDELILEVYLNEKSNRIYINTKNHKYLDIIQK